MKKQLLIIVPIAAIIILAILALGYLLLSGIVLDTGRVLVSDTGTCFIVYEDGFFRMMNDTSWDRDLFEGLGNGDKILILRKGVVAESYPEQCYVKICIRMEKGEIEDIPRNTVEELSSLGYLTTPEASGSALPPSD